MIEIIDPLKERLAVIPALNYVDENTGQLDYYAPNPPVKFPCSLISIASAKFSDTGIERAAVLQNRQLADVLVEIRVANLKLTNSSAKAPAGQKSAALDILRIIQTVHELVHGWTPGGTVGKFIRQGLQQERREDGIQEYSIYYAVSLSDC